MHLDNADAAYLAGVLESRATLHLLRRKGRHPYPTLRVSSVDTELVEWLHTRCGGSLLEQRVPEAHHQRKFEWRVDNRQVLDVLEYALPFCRLDHLAMPAQFLLDHYINLTARNGQYSKAKLARRELMLEEFKTLLHNSYYSPQLKDLD